MKFIRQLVAQFSCDNVLSTNIQKQKQIERSFIFSSGRLYITVNANTYSRYFLKLQLILNSWYFLKYKMQYIRELLKYEILINIYWLNVNILIERVYIAYNTVTIMAGSQIDMIKQPINFSCKFCECLYVCIAVSKL